ncbi:MAG: serine dehydratase [Dehalobacterium sp.]
MERIKKLAQEKAYQLGALTLGETIELAKELGLKVSDVVIFEAQEKSGITYERVLDQVEKAFEHNLMALEIGLTSGKSFLFGRCAGELAENNFAEKLLNDDFVNRAVVYTLAAQIGNHSVGLEPCAGTGDSCPYTGFYRALIETEEKEKALRAAAVMLKVGTLFRAGKTTTGCNMEGYGAGSAAVTAALVELQGGKPEDMARAVVLSLSPTIAVPCTPRVMVAGLCATHIGGAILNGVLSANLACKTEIPVTVPVDVMIALAKAVHPVSAKHVVPTVIKYLQPFFKTNNDVEHYINQFVKEAEGKTMEESKVLAMMESREMAAKANPIIKPFGEAVVGGSSQAVGSPTNAARIAHELARGKIKKVKIELYPELFVRRGINVPGILMGAVYGAHTGDSTMYHEVMGKILAEEIKVEIIQIDEPQVQRITVEASERDGMVDSLNRGGGRLVIRGASPSREEALTAAQKLGIVVVD